MKSYLTLTLAAITGGIISLAAYNYFEKQNPEVRIVEQTPVTYTSFPKAPIVGSMDFTDAAQRTVNSVVHIQTEMVNPQSMDPWYQFFNQGAPRTLQSSGSGVIISEDGYVVTNNHVIDGATRIQVTMNDNKSMFAEVIGADPAYDLALLKIEERNLPFVEFGNSNEVEVGEWVLAVGNPFNLTSTVTAGIVSAKARNINLLEYDPNRSIFPVESFIQTDAAVNPGNSGGALVNTSGELIGINTAIASRTGSYSGYSFAVPSSIVQKVTRDLVEYGDVQRAYIGVSISNLNQDIADRLGITDLKGVYVSGLTPGGAAAEVGIKVDDVILKVGGQDISNSPELQEQVSRYRPGDKIEVMVRRGNKHLMYDVVVKDRDGKSSVEPVGRRASARSLGAIFEDVSKGDLDRLNLANGVRIKQDQQGLFRQAGIKEGFIITRIDKKNIVKPEDVVSLLDSKEGGVLIEGVYPNGTVAYYGFGI